MGAKKLRRKYKDRSKEKHERECRKTDVDRNILFEKPFDKICQNRPFGKEIRVEVIEANLAARSRGGGLEYYDMSKLKDEVIAGGMMEHIDEELKQINKEVEESKRVLQNLTNDVRKTADALHPELLKTIKQIRDSRMTITMELKQSLSIMRDVRKFFLESDHEKEINRLKEFINLADRLKALIEDGTMDAITDVILKLEIGGQ